MWKTVQNVISSWFFFPENWRAPSTRSFRRFLASPSRWEKFFVNYSLIYSFLSQGSTYLPHLCQWKAKVWRWCWWSWSWSWTQLWFEDEYNHNYNYDYRDDYYIILQRWLLYYFTEMIAQMIIIFFFSSRLQSCGAHDHFDDKSLTCVRSTNFLVSEICK